jgi:hypothetical protein
MELNMHDVKRGTSGAYIRASPNFAFVIPVISPDQVFPLYEVRPDNAAFNNVTGAVAKLRVLGDWDIQVIRHGEGRVLMGLLLLLLRSFAVLANAEQFCRAAGKHITASRHKVVIDQFVHLL